MLSRKKLMHFEGWRDYKAQVDIHSLHMLLDCKL